LNKHANSFASLFFLLLAVIMQPLPLMQPAIIDTPTWRKISFLADLRNICSHKKGTEPTKEQVEELIQGAEWLMKNVF
jgi:hypothetical protein